MKQSELKQLFDSLSMEEKLGQMMQIASVLYLSDGAVTGPLAAFHITDRHKWTAGSVLGGSGAAEVRKIQDDYLRQSDKKIPLLFMSDIIHGYQTTFPVPLAIGCSWDLTAAYQTARISAIEGAVSGVHVTFSPMADLVRDARWGRVVESTGEDPYLNAQFAKSFVYGYQIENEAYQGQPIALSDFAQQEAFGQHTLAACAKHFAAYGAAEAGRDYNTVDVSELQLRQFYLPAYLACVQAGCALVMTAFNIVEGVPCTANIKLFRQILRCEWGFDGVVISDWGAVQELIPHGLAQNDQEAAVAALKAGVDIEMMSTTYADTLAKSAESQPELLQMIDDAVWQILTLKNQLGLFENPYRFADEQKEKELLLCEQHREAARSVASKCIVLLQNDNALLPLDKQQKIALIGPFATSDDLLGAWSLHGERKDVVTLEAGLRSAGHQITSVCSGTLPTRESIQEADVLVLALGENSEDTGEGGSKADIRLSEQQLDLLKTCRTFGKPIVTVLFNGRPLVLTDLLPYTDALVEAWFLGTEAGNAIADVLSGAVNPSGKLAMSFPYAVGQIPVYYNHFRTGRPDVDSANRYYSHFLDIPNEPLFPFGYGLSYTSFSYTDASLSSTVLTESLTASVTVTNTGHVTGVETVQFYLRDVSAQVVRPVKQLIHFEQITLQPGEQKEVSYTLNTNDLMYYNSNLEWTADAGAFILMVGGNSRDVDYLEFDYQK